MPRLCEFPGSASPNVPLVSRPPFFLEDLRKIDHQAEHRRKQRVIFQLHQLLYFGQAIAHRVGMLNSAFAVAAISIRSLT